LIKILFLLLVLVNIGYTGRPVWTFTPLTPTKVSVPSNKTAIVQYTVTNHSKKTQTLAMNAMPGIIQDTSGSNCKSPFTLAYQQSCTLKLNVMGSHLHGSAFGGPVLCDHKSKGLKCYQPNSEHILSATLQEASAKTIGLWHESIPSATWGLVMNYNSFLNGDGQNNLGFKAYATDYVNFIANLQSAAQAHNFDLGPIFFQGGDPGPNDWTHITASSNNAFKYLMPNPLPGQRPMINQYVVEPLGKLGVKNFGLVVNLNAWNGTEWIAPWGWEASGSDPSPGTSLPPNINPSAVLLFKLIYELNQELTTSYKNNNIPPSEQLYITLLGFDNEGFNMIPPPNTCTPASSSGVFANLLWNSYINNPLKLNQNTPQWGITGQSPSLQDTCDNQGKLPVPGSQHGFAFIEYYNVPDESNPVYTSDHPGFVPCPAAWSGVVLNRNDIACDRNTEPYFQIAYGVVTPSLSSSSVAGLTRDIPTDDPTQIYNQTAPTWSDIMAGIVNSEIWKRTPTNGTLDPQFIQNAYSMLNKGDNLTTLSQSSLYCAGGCTAGTGTPVQGVQWMLSIENFSSSYQTVNNLTSATPEYISTALVNTQLPFSSVALKYGPNAPFDVTPDKTQYILSHPTNGSGTFEAFGGWGIDNLLALMDYMSQQNPLLDNFMIYEYAFVQLNDTKKPAP